jgi:hypothetical protein|tara:strand:+ start:48 stop:389 length:342 start_codon:yes stop_codon:yes gene_type:complete
MPNYGVIETSSIPEGYHKEQPQGSILWSDKRLAKVIRLRLLSDPGVGFWDVSYCDGRLVDGTKVQVILPFSQLRRKFKGSLTKHINAQIIEYARQDGVYAKGLGIMDAVSFLL